MQKCGQDLSAGCRKPCPLLYLCLTSRGKTPKVPPVIPITRHYQRHYQRQLYGKHPSGWGSWMFTLGSAFQLEKLATLGLERAVLHRPGGATVQSGCSLPNPSNMVLSISVVKGCIRITLGSGIFTTVICLWIIASCSSCEKH